jgi:hypothetical protein
MLRWCTIGLGLQGCAFRDCEDLDPTQLLSLGERLSSTGLYEDIAHDVLAPGVMPFTPRFTLWSDGAEKRRWVLLPEGESLDTSEADFWRFPAGTRFWKEFVRDGVRVETRLLAKVGEADEDWVAVAYQWDGDDAVQVPEGVRDASGTEHDIPAASDCFGCHGGHPSRALGFSALQLSEDGGGLDLAELAESGRLSEPVTVPPLPGETAVRDALGYLHANCGHCHNQDRPETDGPRCYDPDNELDFLLRLDQLGSPEQTPTYRTAAGDVIEPGDPERSALVRRISIRRGGDDPSMPPLGTEVVDVDGVRIIESWIQGL